MVCYGKEDRVRHISNPQEIKMAIRSIGVHEAGIRFAYEILQQHLESEMVPGIGKRYYVREANGGNWISLGYVVPPSYWRWPSNWWCAVHMYMQWVTKIGHARTVKLIKAFFALKSRTEIMAEIGCEPCDADVIAEEEF